MKLILLNIKENLDLYEKYNDDISKELINYLLNEARYIRDDIKINININPEIKCENIKHLLNKGLEKTLEEIKKMDKVNNNKQLIFFLFGLLFLVFSTLIVNEIIKEIIIISGWVAIWETVDVLLNIDSKSALDKKTIKKLINCEIEVNGKKV